MTEGLARGFAARLAREPLVHFLLLGAVLFGAYRLLNAGGPGAGSAGEIVVTQGRIRSLAETFSRTWQRPATAEEMQGLVEDYIREEVLYREAVAIGLDRDDTVIRRRLRQKLEFVSEDSGAAEQPTEQALVEFLAANPESYRIESWLTFRQIFLDPSKRGAGLEADAAGLLDALRSRGGALDPATAGDSLMLEPHYAHATETDVARLFGDEFEAALHGKPVGEWFGPVRSGYGAHLVLIESRTPGRQAELAEVRETVARDWAARRRQEMLDTQYRELRSRYAVRVESE